MDGSVNSTTAESNAFMVGLLVSQRGAPTLGAFGCPVNRFEGRTNTGAVLEEFRQPASSGLCAVWRAARGRVHLSVEDARFLPAMAPTGPAHKGSNSHLFL